MENKSRAELLKALIEFESETSLNDIAKGLASFGWDCEEALVTLKLSDVRAILQRGLAGNLTFEDITLWAELIEVREDIEEEAKNSEQIKEIIFILANPEICAIANMQDIEKLFLQIPADE